MFITLAAPLAYLGLAVLDRGGLADFFAPAPDCYYDRTLRAVWRRRHLGKVILRDIAATAGGPSSYRFGTLGILAGIRQTV